jgi:hypothetical protein
MPRLNAINAVSLVGGFEFPFSVIGICFVFRVSDFLPEREQVAG